MGGFPVAVLVICLFGLLSTTHVDGMCLLRNRLRPGQVPVPLGAQPVWTTLAGYPFVIGTNDGALWLAHFSSPSAVAVDSSNVVYVADSGNSTIRKITPAGVVSTLAGKPGVFGLVDGPANQALFGAPTALAVDAGDNLFVGDGPVIRKVSPAGMVTTVAGGALGYKDANGTNAAFYYINGLAVAPDGTLYVADAGTNNVIRRVTSSGLVSTVAGNPLNSYQDGLSTNSGFNYPAGLALDLAGNLYVADSGSQVIRKITPQGLVSTFAGAGGQADWQDGSDTNAWFNNPSGVALDGDGNLYVADTANACIRKITPAGDVSTIAGTPRVYDHLDGPSALARFNQPSSIACRGNRLVVADAVDITVRVASLDAGSGINIQSQPLNAFVSAGSNAGFQFIAQSTNALSYQWFSGDGPLNDDLILSGATNATLVVSNADQFQFTVFRAAVADGSGYQLSLPCTILLTSPAFEGPEPLARWHPVAGLQPANISAFAYGNGRFLAVGGDGWAGSILDSSDGVRWTKHWPQEWPQQWNEQYNGNWIYPPPQLNDIAFGNGKFVAVGTNGLVLTSTDGLSWAGQALTSAAAPALQSVAFGDGMFVAVSSDDHGSLWASTTGLNWTNIGFEFERHFQQVRFLDERFVAVGNTILVSTNGLVWDAAQLPAESLGDYAVFDSVAYGNGMYLASRLPSPRRELGPCGMPSVFASSTGAEWFDVSPTNGLELAQVSFGNGKFVAFDKSSGGITFSTDGLNWNPPVLVDPNQFPYNPTVAFLQGEFFFSDNILNVLTPLFYSADAVSWTSTDPGGVIPFQPPALTQVQGQYIGSGFLLSTNATDWEELPASYGYSAFAYGAGIVVGVGPYGAVAVSTNAGSSWAEHTVPFNAPNSLLNLNDVTFVNNFFVAVGTIVPANGVGFAPYAQILLSINGVDWQLLPRLSFGGGLRHVVFGNGAFVALSDSAPSATLFSTNGTDWTRGFSADNNTYLPSLAFGNGRFVVSGPGTALISTDGRSWSQYALNGGPDPNTVLFGNGLFLGAGGNSVYNSIDGLHWSAHSTAMSLIFSLYAGEGVFLAWGQDMYGNQGLFESDPIEQLGQASFRPNGQFQLGISGARNRVYDIQATEDFSTWQLLGTISNSAPNQPFIDPAAPTHPRRFYRLLVH
jgi:sugar lactone lactonase YvrE